MKCTCRTMRDEMSSSYGSHTTELASVGRSNSTGSPLRVTLVVYSIAWGDALRATPLVTLLCCVLCPTEHRHADRCRCRAVVAHVLWRKLSLRELPLLPPAS